MVEEARVPGGQERVHGGGVGRGEVAVQVEEQAGADGQAGELVGHQRRRRRAHGGRQTPVAHPQGLVQARPVHPPAAQPPVAQVAVVVVVLLLALLVVVVVVVVEGPPRRAQQVLEVVAGPAG